MNSLIESKFTGKIKLEIIKEKLKIGRYEPFKIYPDSYPVGVANFKKINPSTTIKEEPPDIKIISGFLNFDEFKNILLKEKMRAVGLITSKYVNDFSSDPVARGTCILVGPQWILTAHHVLPNHEFAQNFHVVFDFISENSEEFTKSFTDALRIPLSFEDGDYFSSKDGVFSDDGHHYMNGDWALIKLKSVPKDIKPLIPRKITADDSQTGNSQFVIPYYLSGLWTLDDGKLIVAGDTHGPLNIAPLHFLLTPPGEGYPEYNKLDLDSNFNPTQDWKVMHFISAANGASGAPLMAPNGQFVGIHVRSYKEDGEFKVGGPTPEPGLASNAYVIAKQLASLGFDAEREGVTLNLKYF